eukprot:GSChrysophyteH2.ASY1.ANO1.294.1 assembled CDS
MKIATKLYRRYCPHWIIERRMALSSMIPRSILPRIHTVHRIAQNRSIMSSSAGEKVRIAVLGSAADTHGPLVVLDSLPSSARVVAIGANVEEWQNNEKWSSRYHEANVLLIASANGKILSEALHSLPQCEWIQGVFAGLDHLQCPEFTEFDSHDKKTVTNAKGVFSSSLAEWGLFAAAYWNKNLPRFRRNQQAARWETFTVGELRGKTFGIIGYGDIGQKTAVLAKAYGMNVIACRRRPNLSKGDSNCDACYGMEEMASIMKRSDFIFVAAALTPTTEGMISREMLNHAKDGQVFINIGRGKLVDEEALTEILTRNAHSAAALDVFTIEPLPASSPLWALPNVLISSHNADMTEGFRHRSVAAFVENVRRFVGEGGAESGHGALVNVVNAKEGY